MSACIGMMNSKSINESQFNFDSENNFTLGDKRRRYRLQQRSNSQVFVPIKRDDDFTVLDSSPRNNINNKKKSIDKIKNIEKNHEKEKLINNSVIMDNYSKKLKLTGKNNLAIKKKMLNNSDDNCDIIECDDEFEYDNNILNYIKNTDILIAKKSNFSQGQNNQNSNSKNIKTIKPYSFKQENGKEKEKENELENNNNDILNDSYNNKDLNMELSISKNKITINDAQRSTIFGNLINNEENGGKTLDNDNNKNLKENSNKKEKENRKEENKTKENKLFVIKDYYEGGISNLKYNQLFKISKNNDISFSQKNEAIRKVVEDNYSNIKENKNTRSLFDLSQKNNSIKSSNKKKKDFSNCKIDNNINFNIENSNLNNDNNNLNNNMNNINNINNISSINSDFNNNNFIDASSNMTYLLSLEKSQRKKASSRFERKAFSLHKNNEPNNNISYCSKEINSNNYRNSVRENKYKWKLLPKQKYNTQIYKSLNNIPLSHESQSLLINEEDQKNLNSNLKNDNNENNNNFISEIKKQKEQQDKVIKSLENKIKNLEKKINEEKNKEEENNQKITKLEKYIDKKNTKKNIKQNLINNFNKNINSNEENNDSILLEAQKDFKIKKLEEQLDKVKKDNKINKTLLKKKDKQIQNLLNSKNKQDKLIKQYEFMKNNIPKNNNFTTKGNKKIKYLDDISNSMSSNNFNSNSNHYLTESKISFSDFRTNKNSNSNNSININKEKNIKAYKKENSITIRKNFFKHNSSSLNDFFGLGQGQDNVGKARASLKENTKLKLNKNSNAKNINKFNVNNNTNKNSSNISYYNYCNDLTNKSKNNYNTKITLNKMKMYKLNTLNLTVNNDNKINKLLKEPTNGTNKGKKEEINFNEYNTNTTTSKTSRKKFSFTKSKKLLKKNSEVNLKEMYLKAGTVRGEENSGINNYTNFNHVKSFSYTEIPLLNNKNSFTNSNNNTTVTNKNNNDINLSLCPLLSPSNFSIKNHIESLSVEDNLNLSENINNILISNPSIKSNSNEQIKEMNKIYQKYWNEGFLIYKKLNENSKNEENNIYTSDDGLMKLKFCMANELFEVKANKEESICDIKNKFLEIFFERKTYGEKEKRYIDNNIIFLKKEGAIDINKKLKEVNLENNEIIIPVLKDVTC